MRHFEITEIGFINVIVVSLLVPSSDYDGVSVLAMLVVIV